MDEKDIKHVLVERKDQIGNAGPALTFIFTMLTMCFWGIYQGIYTGPVTLAVGLVQIACFAPYLIGAILFYLKGDSLNGNAFLIFATLFGGIGGFSNTMLGLVEMFGWAPMNAQMSAIPFIWGGISIFPVLWCIRKVCSKMTFICFFAAALFLTIIGLVTLNILPASLNTLIKWLGLIVALTGYYEALNGLLASGGSKGMPNGKPFFK